MRKSEDTQSDRVVVAHLMWSKDCVPSLTTAMMYGLLCCSFRNKTLVSRKHTKSNLSFLFPPKKKPHVSPLLSPPPQKKKKKSKGLVRSYHCKIIVKESKKIPLLPPPHHSLNRIRRESDGWGGESARKSPTPSMSSQSDLTDLVLAVKQAPEAPCSPKSSSLLTPM